jgi:hypothetical protein
MEGSANGGAGAGAGGLGGRCAGVPYLAMLLCDPGSPDWDAMRFMDVAETVPCMLWGEPYDGVDVAEALGLGIWIGMEA